MKFHLDYNPQSRGIQISQSDKFILIGSCFSDYIGEKLCSHGFQSLNNPFGIVFNPISLAKQFNFVLDEMELPEGSYVIKEGKNVNYFFHSFISASSPEQLQTQITETKNLVYEQLKNARFLIITFGSAYVYQLKNTGLFVANCHKQAQQLFGKHLLSTEEITAEWVALIKKLQVLNPDLQIIFTVSPVKYLRDGLEQNFISKSTLRLAIDNIIRQSDNCSYFPSFELVTDDLRDYRFYKEDLAHPNTLAVQYVWEKFSECYFDATTKKQAMEHFEQNRLSQHLPHFNFTTEKKEQLNGLESRLKALLQDNAGNN